MSAITSRCHNHRSALGSSEPIADALVLRCRNIAYRPTHHAKNWPISPYAEHLGEFNVAMIHLITTRSPSAELQIPIARSLR